MSIRLFILGTLAEKVCHPYMIKKIISETVHLDKILNLSDGRLYYHFEALQKKGYIKETQIIQESNRPDKTLYEITAAGRQALEDGIYKSFKNITDIVNIYISIQFLSYVDSKKVARILEGSIEEKKERWDHYKKLYHQHKDDETIINNKPLLLIANHSFNRTDLDVEWLEELLEYIKSLD